MCATKHDVLNLIDNENDTGSAICNLWAHGSVCCQLARLSVAGKKKLRADRQLLAGPSAPPLRRSAAPPLYRLASRSRYRFRNLATFGAITTWQYAWSGFSA
jgi:hypothetical protein